MTDAELLPPLRCPVYMNAVFSGLLLLALLAGCGGATPRTRTPTQREVVDMEELRITARRTDEGDYEFESYDAETLFRRGNDLAARGRCDDAVRHYDRIASEFASSRWMSPALYNAGLCLKEGGRLEDSAARFTRLIATLPTSPDAADAQFQLVEVQLGLEHWAQAQATAESILAREQLTPDERMEALARQAQAVLGAGRTAEAERHARAALSYYRTRPESAPVRDNYFAAAANFVLAETLRTRSQGLAIPEGDVQAQRQVLEQRAQLILDAQREYFNTIRFTDARWAAAAGYRIGSMYDELWEAIMTAPIPPPRTQMNAAEMQIYRDEFRRELQNLIKPLIRHAIRYWELTLMMIERTGVQTEWAVRTRTELEEARQRLLEQPPGAGGLPPRDAANAQQTQPEPPPPEPETDRDSPSEPEPPAAP